MRCNLGIEFCCTKRAFGERVFIGSIHKNERIESQPARC
jgi:hypothetical protein